MSVRWTIIGVVIGAILGRISRLGHCCTHRRRAQQGNTARELLSEVTALVSLKEGWLLQGQGSRTAKLSDKPGLSETQSGSGLWLLPVEIRAILDEAQWNSHVQSELRLHARAQGLDHSEIKYCLTHRFHTRASPKTIFRRSLATQECKNCAPGLNGCRLLTTAGH